MTISIKLLDDISSIEKKVNTALANKINDILSKKAQDIVRKIQYELIPKWIYQQPEMQALASGELQGQFGTMLSPAVIANSIVMAIVNSVSMSMKKFNNQLRGGGLEIKIQPVDFNNLLQLPQGHTIYSGGDLHWLEWMLLRGDQIIVVGYEYNPQTGLGRTGLGNMIAGKGFRVPPQYSGTDSNNFITRALIGQQQNADITKVFKEVLES